MSATSVLPDGGLIRPEGSCAAQRARGVGTRGKLDGESWVGVHRVCPAPRFNSHSPPTPTPSCDAPRQPTASTRPPWPAPSTPPSGLRYVPTSRCCSRGPMPSPAASTNHVAAARTEPVPRIPLTTKTLSTPVGIHGLSDASRTRHRRRPHPGPVHFSRRRLPLHRDRPRRPRHSPTLDLHRGVPVPHPSSHRQRPRRPGERLDIELQLVVIERARRGLGDDAFKDPVVHLPVEVVGVPPARAQSAPKVFGASGLRGVHRRDMPPTSGANEVRAASEHRAHRSANRSLTSPAIYMVTQERDRGVGARTRSGIRAPRRVIMPSRLFRSRLPRGTRQVALPDPGL